MPQKGWGCVAASGRSSSDGYNVIQAGAYLTQEYIDRQVSRFAAKGIKVYLEPVKVAKTLHQLRFVSFASRAEAETAARKASAFGVQVQVVRSRKRATTGTNFSQTPVY